jgi:cysteine synthase
MSVTVEHAAGRRCDSPTQLVGRTPILRIGAPVVSNGRQFWAKLEGWNPGGIKDRAAIHVVARARERGDLRPGGTIVESTSGTLGLGLALAGIAFGHPVTLVADPGLEPLMRHLLVARGVRLEIVPEPHPTGGWQQARRQRLHTLLAEIPDAWCPDQYDNPDFVEAYRPLGHELLDQLGPIDVLVCSVGTGGHSAGVARTLRERLPGLRVIGVDTVGSTVFGQPAQPKLMRGLGSSIYPGNVAYDLFDEVHWVSPAEAVAISRLLARTVFVTGGWSVGAVALVARWAAERWPATASVAAIFPDGPQRYWNSVLDDEFCREHGLLGAKCPRAPQEIAHPTERVAHRWTRCRTVLDPCPDRRHPTVTRGAWHGDDLPDEPEYESIDHERLSIGGVA